MTYGGDDLKGGKPMQDTQAFSGARVAADIMTRPVVAAGRSTTARDVAIQMFLGGFSGMPVTERDGTVIGVVTEFDVIRAIRGGKPVETTLVGDIMSKDVVAVDLEAPIDDIVAIFEREKILRVPVTERGKLVGVVSRPDVLRWLVEPNFMTFA
jgi:CBS domain-containing protein